MSQTTKPPSQTTGHTSKVRKPSRGRCTMMRSPIHRIPPSYVEEYALPGVEPHEPAAVVRFNHEEDDRRDDRDVSQHRGDVIGESRTGAGWDNHAAPSACRACSCAIGNLCATHIAKRHWSFLRTGNWKSAFGRANAIRATLRKGNRKRCSRQSSVREQIRTCPSRWFKLRLPASPRSRLSVGV